MSNARPVMDSVDVVTGTLATPSRFMIYGECPMSMQELNYSLFFLNSVGSFYEKNWGAVPSRNDEYWGCDITRNGNGVRLTANSNADHNRYDGGNHGRGQEKRESGKTREEAKLRELKYTPEGGTETTVKIPAAAIERPEGGGTFPPQGWTEQTRAIQIRYDSTYHKLQVKTGTVLVRDETEASTWTDVIPFEEFDTE